MPEVRSPTVRRRELGALLRSLRLEQGFTVDQVAERLLCSPSKVSRMETGARGATARDVRDLCELYGVTDPTQREHMARLAAEGRQQGWWQGYELDYFGTYVGLEQEATSIRIFQSTVVPGLLQTESYARATLEAVVPEFTTERIDQLVQVRLTRQQSLTRDPPLRLWVVLDESVLHRMIGGISVMREQLERLLEAAKSPRVTIQVIPYSAGAHPAMESTFDILGFSEPTPGVVYVEGLIGYIYLERPQDLRRYQLVFERLSQVALNPQDSTKLIAEIGARYNIAPVPAAHDASDI